MFVTEVDEWMARYDNPKKDVVQRVRLIVLSADDRVSEVIKWGTPTFVYHGDIASFAAGSMNHATLVFHHGGRIPGKFPHLEGTGEGARAMRIVSTEEAEVFRDEIVAIVQSWIRVRGG